MDDRWTRAERLAASGIAVTMLSVVAAIYLPEVRRSLHLDPPQVDSSLQVTTATQILSGSPATPNSAPPDIQSSSSPNSAARPAQKRPKVEDVGHVAVTGNQPIKEASTLAPLLPSSDAMPPSEPATSDPATNRDSSVPSGGMLAQPDVEGTIVTVDTATGTIQISANDGSVSVTKVAANTPVFYQGSPYTLANLERGDHIRIKQVREGVSAARIDVVQSVTYPTTVVVGQVLSVDPRQNVIQIRVGNGAVQVIQAASNTPVLFKGDRYRIVNLEPGDTVRISLIAQNALAIARHIEVVQSRQR